MIGEVTSCSLDAKGTLTGQAYVDKSFSKKGTPLLIYPGMRGKELEPGAEGAEAVVLKRF